MLTESNPFFIALILCTKIANSSHNQNLISLKRVKVKLKWPLKQSVHSAMLSAIAVVYYVWLCYQMFTLFTDSNPTL
jgi:hypothetical protein